MSKEIRRVRPDWQHPTADRGWFEPQFAEEVTEEHTAYQVYEDVTEGTPISPVFLTKRELLTFLRYYLPQSGINMLLDIGFCTSDTLHYQFWGEECYMLDDLGPYWGKATDEKWNGFACPLFRREEVCKMIADFRLQWGWRCEEVDGTFYIWPTDTPEQEPEIFSKRPDRLYAIGAYSWTWIPV